MSNEKVKYLRLVEVKEESAKPNLEDLEPLLSKQTSLFSDASRATLGFIAVANMSDATFQALLSDVRPRFIFDLRRVPSFSVGALTRRTVFALFKAYDIRYYDVAGALDISGPKDASSNPRLLVPKILQILLRRRRALIGPVLFFVDAEYLTEDFIDGVESMLPHEDGRGWEVSIWDEKEPTREDLLERRTVFISHANPQDNDVARWLGTRLAAEGYEVWSDITKLIGESNFGTRSKTSFEKKPLV